MDGILLGVETALTVESPACVETAAVDMVMDGRRCGRREMNGTRHQCAGLSCAKYVDASWKKKVRKFESGAAGEVRR